MSNLLKNLLLVLGLIIVLWLGYKLFIKDAGTESTTDVDTAAQTARETKGFLEQLQILRNVKLNGGVFSDIRFTILVDLRQELLPENTGRTNPFAPVE